ncbi:MAG: carboxypeptidase-like regulatory domain-containing protein [Acidobacteriia bacterium]|nr:carboxypeptidase-like regulatory domain-containing protein [Terriglobia bacterium]
MPAYGRERRPLHWIWLLAILILAVLLFLSYRQGLFTGSRGTREKSGTEPLQPASKSVAEGPSTAALQPQDSTLGQQAAPASPASDTWYTSVAFKGVVLNETNRTPVDGATVRIFAYSSPSSVVDKTTSAGGKFEIVAPPAYRYGVKAEADGFRSYQEDSFVITRPYYDLEILLTPTLLLRGRVVDSLNAGVGDALVQLRREDDRTPAFLSVTTDQQGVFTFTEVPRYGRLRAEAYHPAFDSLGAVAVTLPAESDVVIRMTATRITGSLAGIVTDTVRKPVAAARISLFDPNQGRLLSTVQTDTQGLYRFARMREGNYLVRCAADGFVDARTNQGIAAISANREARLDFSLEPGLQIRGVVVNQKEEPVVQAQVMCSPGSMQRGRQAGDPGAGRMAIMMRDMVGDPQRGRGLEIATTDSEGRFQISGLTDTQYQVTVSHRDYQSLLTRVRPSNEPQKLVMDAGLSLRGTVSDVRGAAVERFTLTFQSTAGRSEKSYSFTTTDGHFEIRGLARDTYQVSLQTSGRGRFSGTLDLSASTEVFVVLDPANGGRGRSPLNFLKAR